MAFTGLYSVLFSAPDMKVARKFFADWGLKKISDDRSGAVFKTQIGSEIIVRPLSARNMPPPMSPVRRAEGHDRVLARPRQRKALLF